MRSIIFLVAISSFLSVSCQNQTNTPVVEKRDTTITAVNAYNELFLDSTKLEAFIATNKYDDSLANHFRSFYNSRNYQYAWFSGDGEAEHANHFLNLQNDYIGYSRDSSLYNAHLQQIIDTLNSSDSTYRLTPAEMLNTELLLTSQFFTYAQRAYLGDKKLNTADLKWFIPRKKLDMVGLLDSVLKPAAAGVDVYEPVNRQYKMLKKELIRYSSIQKEGGWAPVSGSQKKFVKGDTAEAIRMIKKRLYKTGDFVSADTSNLFTDSLESAVKRMQKRYGMKEDGVVGGATLREMNQSIDFRIRQMLINLERFRWVPAEVNSDYLLVNIPQFKLHVYEQGKLSFSMNVVVGSLQHNTVIFNGDLKYVVFSPYWNVPPSIVKNEILPGIQRNKNYIAGHNMEITGYSGKLPNVRQKPGPNNSLGKVKFLFPNSYNIYLHDTPAKSLFGETNRAFSHGCIRLGEPRKLAEFLLRNDKSWTTEKIRQAMDAGKERYVTLTKPVPVFIGYFTAWVDSEGLLNFRDDVYGHDAKLAEKMFMDSKSTVSLVRK
ncbi:L,D-transpeptidase family protein [Flavitalea antarctica]